ncbi:MAG TPA: winged helix-turn-helix domain-containing protein, partial [Euzebyales bacterium]|nr:winged helix-turn-helix domain-containing protein [Euzebyales bacterium]
MPARDVVAFGREVGRVLSDGRIVGRAEPFAKAFASSREVKRAVGATAWVILEDIALDAAIDDRGRLVAHTSVRQIADHLGLNKTPVARHLARLRDHGFVLHEEARDHASGRWDASRYLLDPSACVERFTHTPPAEQARTDSPVRDEPVDRADGTVSASTG